MSSAQSTPAAPQTPPATVKVLVVDDSAVVRQVLTRELGRYQAIQVIGSAPDPYVARDMIVELKPDVITLDVEMPRMDGITFLRKLMAHHPMPVIILSSLTAQGTDLAIAAMEAGAVDVMSKPGSAYTVTDVVPLLASKIKAASLAKARAYSPSFGGTSPAAARPRDPGAPSTIKIVAIGASTGGVQALTEVLAAFPADAPGTVVVQHMPPGFTTSFAMRLDNVCRVEVKEAENGDTIAPGRVLIAPGGYHTLVRRSGDRYYVQIEDGPDVNHQKPSVDVLLKSVARYAGSSAIGIILTGMGADGARGLLAMRRAGARTIAQDEQSSIVFGMPMEAIRCGAAERVLPLDAIATEMIDLSVA